ncbi:3-hydroxyisobutyryl-CoA hydrolase-like protein 5 isoform X2 [Actinidia eriantha]|uniref:3-hydroxyisobutyryl-CoA hydrolase-like protein 5 isoform X2 n=1 Tax=Actinidia eriantha TaxID=165200 RepID=UPI00258974D2|nr:3-hydroxyisobutyryl-CoA hydrolase-like protein 5 isoform X2 [Actinidia eriantha]
MFYDGRNLKDSCLEFVYRMYWLCYHIHTYRKTQVALVHGISMGRVSSLMVPVKFSVVTEKTEFFQLQKQVLGFTLIVVSRTCFPIFLGVWGSFFTLIGGRLNGKELVAAGLATHFVPSEESEASKEGNAWIGAGAVLKGLKRSSPMGLKNNTKIGRKQKLSKCLEKEFSLTMNILWTTISGDVYEALNMKIQPMQLWR